VRRGASRLLAWWAAALALVWAASRGPITVIEVLVLLAVVAGLSVTLRRPARDPGLIPLSRAAPDPELAAATVEVFESLDGIEHRRVEIGYPWPAVVVGPTGVHLVDVCPFADGPGACSAPLEWPGEGCARCQRNASIAGLIDRTLAGLEVGGRHVPVRTLAVVGVGSPGVRATAPAAREAVAIVPVDRLADALARGPLLPMAVVERAYRSLAVLAAARSAPQVLVPRR
jgi:hypothetical protein